MSSRSLPRQQAKRLRGHCSEDRLTGSSPCLQTNHSTQLESDSAGGISLDADPLLGPPHLI
ncbi:hypothetical protein EV13_1052 [Prochlorococcus sp. MIT 0702]|nr:hypothetical protein EV13_1052 [Prochlorococcus sp. MIT 0702]